MLVPILPDVNRCAAVVSKVKNYSPRAVTAARWRFEQTCNRRWLAFLLDFGRLNVGQPGGQPDVFFAIFFHRPGWRRLRTDAGLKSSFEFKKPPVYETVDNPD